MQIEGKLNATRWNVSGEMLTAFVMDHAGVHEIRCFKKGGVADFVESCKIGTPLSFECKKDDHPVFGSSLKASSVRKPSADVKKKNKLAPKPADREFQKTYFERMAEKDIYPILYFTNKKTFYVMQKLGADTLRKIRINGMEVQGCVADLRTKK